jgi:hypothetical protein
VLTELKAVSKTSLEKTVNDVLEGQEEGTTVMFRNRAVYLPPPQTWAQTVAMSQVTLAQDLESQRHYEVVQLAKLQPYTHQVSVQAREESNKRRYLS